MITQVGLPFFLWNFMKLSCADLQWDEFMSIIGKGKGEKLASEKRSSMDYFERRIYLNFDPVLPVHQLQYRIEAFFQTIVLNGSLGRIKYFALS